MRRLLQVQTLRQAQLLLQYRVPLQPLIRRTRITDLEEEEEEEGQEGLEEEDLEGLDSRSHPHQIFLEFQVNPTAIALPYGHKSQRI
jgi:hypothetical protein